ncbi:hypothetical protein B9Z55_004379 [Caenorhabditis nigoni]|nr:hypothetical protein B9Z55_004379 [Caenorhabditis nigoni]
MCKIISEPHCQAEFAAGYGARLEMRIGCKHCDAQLRTARFTLKFLHQFHPFSTESFANFDGSIDEKSIWSRNAAAATYSKRAWLHIQLYSEIRSTLPTQSTLVHLHMVL